MPRSTKSPRHTAPPVPAADAPAGGGGPSNLLAPLLGLHEGGARLHWSKLLAESFIFTALSTYIAYFIAPDHTGIMSIALGAAALSGRMEGVLKDNRDNIFVHHLGSRDANARTAGLVLTIFIGITSAYAGATLLMGLGRASQSFHFVLEAARFSPRSLATHKFGSFSWLVAHNSVVLGCFFVLSFVYWAYGALLALAMNAATWGVVLTLLVGFTSRAKGGGSAVLVIGSVVAVVPHLILEAVSYLLAALSGIFLSRGVARYNFSSATFLAVARASAILLAFAFAALLAGALLESRFAPWLLSVVTAR